MPAHDRRDRFEFPTRGRARGLWNVLFRVLRWIASHAKNTYATFGIFLLSGTAVGVGMTYAFAKLAKHVLSGGTQPFDDAVLRCMGAHQIPWVTEAMVELTSLGTGIVVAAIVVVAGLFLWLYDYKQSATLLLVATLGGLLLNNVLKL